MPNYIKCGEFCEIYEILESLDEYLNIAGRHLEDEFGKAGLADNSDAAVAGNQKQAKQPVNNHDHEKFEDGQQPGVETDTLGLLKQQRHRRSGVCLSMLGENDLQQTLMQSKSYGLMEQVNDLPQLQVNGIECEVDKECSDTSLKTENKDGDPIDEGQIQCAVSYDNESNVLMVNSVTVRTKMDPGIPGFFVEVSLLPKQTISAKSRVYVTASSDVNLTLKEGFELTCLKPDLEQNSLFLAVKPMYSETVLYAETDLKDLSLNEEREILLGGYLKSLSTHYA